MIAYAAGYIPCAMFSVPVEPGGENRLEIYMIDEKNSSMDTAVCLTQAPQRAWVEAIVEEFAP